MRPRLTWPAGLRSADPFQVAMLVIAIARGISYMTGFLPASVAERALPHWSLLLCLGELAVGALVTLAAMLWPSPAREKRGLTLLGISAALYAGILEYERPRAAALSFVVYGALALACYWRRRQIDLIRGVVRSVTSEMP